MKYEEGKGRTLSQALQKAVTLIGAAACVFHLYTAYFGVLEAMSQRAVHLAFFLTLIFLTTKITHREGRWNLIFDMMIILLLLSSIGYLLYDYEQVAYRIGEPDPWDTFFGILLTLIVLESGRRTVGMGLPIIAVASLLYAYLGPHMPGLFAHRGYSLKRIFSHIYMGGDGIFGIPLDVSSTFIVMFVIFGGFLEASGGGEFFIKLGNAAVGRYRGGPAKTAVIASALMGTISGSGVANVVTTGTFTIPLMKRLGYRAHVAGAIEAAASTGGQIMPPIMGAAAFVMVGFLETSYLKVCIAAAIPAVLYFTSVFTMVHLEAIKEGLKGLPSEKIPSLRVTLKEEGHLLLPLLGLIIFLVVGYSPMKSAFLAIVSLYMVSWLRKSTSLTPRRTLQALLGGARGMTSIAATCAIAGIVVGVFSLTGLGLKISELIISISKGSLLLALVLTMVTSIILGMGMPTTPAYIILAILVVPAMVSLGISPLVAHMFIFYFGCLSLITPPVCVASYAAAGIAGSDSMKTGWTAFKFSLAGFIVPFMFVYSPALLFIGKLPFIILSFVTGCLGVVILAMSLEGYFLGKLTIWEKVILFASAICLIKPGIITDSLGILLFISITIFRWWRIKNRRKGGGH